jgi:hypothetical protein
VHVTKLYRPENSWFESDRTLVMGVSTYSGPSPDLTDLMASGVERFSPDHPDYDMWCVLRDRYRKIERPAAISDEDLVEIRQQFKRDDAASHKI